MGMLVSLSRNIEDDMVVVPKDSYRFLVGLNQNT